MAGIGVYPKHPVAEAEAHALPATGSLISMAMSRPRLSKSLDAAEHAWRPSPSPLAPFLSRAAGEEGGDGSPSPSPCPLPLTEGERWGLEKKNDGKPLTQWLHGHGMFPIRNPGFCSRSENTKEP